MTKLPLKVVFLSPYNIKNLEPEIRYTDILPRTKHAASWIRVISEGLAGSNEEINLTIVTCDPDVLEDQIIVKNNITFIVLRIYRIPAIIRKVFSLNFETKIWLDAIWKINKLLRKLNPDVIHVHGTESWYALSTIGIRIPTVISIQGIINEIYKDGKIHHELAKQGELIALKRAKYINPKTKFSVSFLEKIKSTAKQFYIEASIDKRYWNISSSYQKRMIFVGAVTKMKGIFEFLDVFFLVKEKHTDMTAIVVGHYEENLINLIQERYSSKQYFQDIFFTGQLNVEKICDIYKEGGVFCLFSKSENSPNVIMEAMAAGLPVVATNVGSVSNMVLNGESGFVVSLDDISEMASCITKLLDSETLYHQFGALGKQISENRWHVNVNLPKHLAMYNEIIKLEGRSF
jgi:glycosyltransferase involved in cell wall biosynthesis